MQHRAGRCASDIAAESIGGGGRMPRIDEVARLVELLRGGDRLEVHAQDRRDAGIPLAGVILPVQPIQHGHRLDRVVALGVGVGLGPVRAAAIVGGSRRAERGRIGDVAVDLGRKQVVDAIARRSAEDLVRGVLVGPGGAHPVVMDDFEHGVHQKVIVRIHRQARLRIQRQLRCIDQIDRVARQQEDLRQVGRAAGIEARNSLPAVDARGILRHDFGIEDLRPSRCMLAVGLGSAGGQQVPAVCIVVVDARRARVAARHLGDHARKRIRGERRPCIRERDPTGDEARHGRARVRRSEPLQIGFVKAVDRDQEHVLHVILVPIVLGCRIGQHGDRRPGSSRQGAEHQVALSHGLYLSQSSLVLANRSSSSWSRARAQVSARQSSFQSFWSVASIE